MFFDSLIPILFVFRFVAIAILTVGAVATCGVFFMTFFTGKPKSGYLQAQMPKHLQTAVFLISLLALPGFYLEFLEWHEPVLQVLAVVIHLNTVVILWLFRLISQVRRDCTPQRTASGKKSDTAE